MKTIDAFKDWLLEVHEQKLIKVREKTQKRINKMGTVFIITTVILGSLSLTGCFLNPVKNYKSFPDGRTEWNFNTGLNLELGASATDTLDNSKSIKPDMILVPPK